MRKILVLLAILVLLLPGVFAGVRLPGRLVCYSVCSFSFDVVDQHGPRRWDCSWDGEVLTVVHMGVVYSHPVYPPLTVYFSVDAQGRYVMYVGGTRYYISEPGGQVQFSCSGCTVEEWIDWGTGGGGGGGGGCECGWWDIFCHMRCALMAFFNWLIEQIVKLLPQPVRDFFSFMGSLFGFLGQLIVKMVEYFPYFLFTMGLVFTFGFIYYVVEYGVVGIGMYFKMLYELFRKFFELILRVIELIIPF